MSEFKKGTFVRESSSFARMGITAAIDSALREATAIESGLPWSDLNERDVPSPALD